MLGAPTVPFTLIGTECLLTAALPCSDRVPVGLCPVTAPRQTVRQTSGWAVLRLRVSSPRTAGGPPRARPTVVGEARSAALPRPRTRGSVESGGGRGAKSRQALRIPGRTTKCDLYRPHPLHSETRASKAPDLSAPSPYLRPPFLGPYPIHPLAPHAPPGRTPSRTIDYRGASRPLEWRT